MTLAYQVWLIPRYHLVDVHNREGWDASISPGTFRNEQILIKRFD
jgi:hypothetical protein